MEGVSAHVLLGVKISMDGRVQSAALVQTSLLYGSMRPHGEAKMVKLFERSAVNAAMHWKFAVDTEHFAPNDADLTIVTTVGYSVERKMAGDISGKWEASIRTSRRELPWLPADSSSQRVGVSDVNPGEMTPVANSIRLASDPIGKAL